MNAAATRVAVEEFTWDGEGLEMYRARCLDCSWRTRWFHTERTAVGHAKAHLCEVPATSTLA